MQKDTSYADDYCPIEETIRVVGGRWKPVILYHLLTGPKRFNALRRLIPRVTQRMLTQHLRELESDGIIDRQVLEQVPPHVEYSFTAKGQTLLPVLDAMAVWGHEHNGRLSHHRAQEIPLSTDPGRLNSNKEN